MEVFAVQTSLTLNDQLLAGLRRVAAQLRLLDSDVQRLQNRLNSLKVSPGLIGQFNALRSAMGAATMNARQANSEMRQMRVSPVAATTTQTLSRNLATATTRARALSRVMATMPAVGGGGGGFVGGGGAAPGWTTGTSRRPWGGTRSWATTGTPPGGGGAAPPGAAGSPAAGGRGRGGAGVYPIFEGVGLAYMGGAVAHGIGKALKPAKDYQHELALMDQTSMTHEQRIQAIGQAWKTSKEVMTTTPAGNLGAIQELRQVFGGASEEQFGHVLQNLPTIQKMQGVLGAYSKNPKDDAYTAARALEMRGAVKDPARFVEEADLMTKAIGASRGKVTADDFMSAFKYGRGATQNWDKDFTYKILPTLIQELKTRGGAGAGGGPGNPLMSAYAAIVGGTISQKALGVYNELGLLDPQKLIFSKTGALKGVKPGGVAGWELFQSNPIEWLKQYVNPAMDKKGMSEAEKAQKYQYLFPNRTAGFIASQMGMQGWKFERDVPLYEGQRGISAYGDLETKDPNMVIDQIHKQGTSVFTALGNSFFNPDGMGFGLLKGIRNSMSGTAGFLHENQGVADAVGTAGVVAGGLVALGLAVKGLGMAVRGVMGLPGMGMLGRAAMLGGGAVGLGVGAVATALARRGETQEETKNWLGTFLHPAHVNWLSELANDAEQRRIAGMFSAEGESGVGVYRHTGPGTRNLGLGGGFAAPGTDFPIPFSPLGSKIQASGEVEGAAGVKTETVERVANVSLAGEATFSGSINVNMGSLGSIIEQAVLKGIMRGAGSAAGGASHSSAHWSQGISKPSGT